MVVSTTFDYEVTTSIPPERFFKVITFDKSYVPTVFPQGIKSIDMLEGDGGVGSIFLITFEEGSHILKSAKHRVEKIDKENLIYSNTIVEVELASGGPADDHGIESVTDVVALSPYEDGGSIVKASCTYNTKGDVGVSEEQIRGKERIEFMVKSIQEFCIANPDAYN